jgi:hypothetical protein
VRGPERSVSASSYWMCDEIWTSVTPMDRFVNQTLRRLGEGLRTRRNRIVQQRLPWRIIDLLCRLDEREEHAALQVGDSVRLERDGRVLTVVELLEAGQVTCRDMESGRLLILSANDLARIAPLERASPQPHP